MTATLEAIQTRNFKKHSMNLETAAETAAETLLINPVLWTKFMIKLRPLKEHHEGMYAHSLRVGLYAYGIAQTEQWGTDGRLALFGGCGHDIGKVCVPPYIFDKTEQLNETEWDCIKNHPRVGYEMLKDDFLFAAYVAGLHHSLTNKSYGLTLQDLPDYTSQQLVLNATQLVMICDCWDAMTTRRNASTVVDPDDVAGVCEMMQEKFSEFPERINWLKANLIKG